MDPSLTPKDLIERLPSAEAWEALYQGLQPLILSWSRRSGLSVCDAEDLTQEVWARLVRLWDGHKLFDPSRMQSFLPFLRVLVRNVITDTQRRRRPPTLTDAEPETDLASLPGPQGQDGISTLIAEDFQTAVAARLDERGQQLLRLLSQGIDKSAELCTQLGISQPTLWRLRLRLVQVTREVMHQNEPH